MKWLTLDNLILTSWVFIGLYFFVLWKYKRTEHLSRCCLHLFIGTIMASFLSQNYMNMKCKILTTPLIQSPLCGMFRAQLLQLCFWSAWRLLVFYLKCLHSPTLCFAGQEQNGATHNGGESEGDTGLTSPVPPQRKKLAPPSISPPSIPLSSPTSRKPAHPRPALRPLDSDFSRHEVKIQAGQRSDPMVTTNGESRVTVSRAQSFQGWRPQLKETTGKQATDMLKRSITVFCDTTVLISEASLKYFKKL